MALVAETQLYCGAVERAELLIDEALALGAELPDPMWEAEVSRMKGELLLLHSPGEAGDRTGAGATHFFDRALAIARRQGSRALQDRAASSLARMAATS